MGLMLDRGAERCDPTILQPAEPFLDLVGEAIRSRLFLSDAGDGQTMCLRPEFTVPAARNYLSTDGGARRYALAGTVFARGVARVELPQAGIESLGATDRAAEDARTLADAIEITRDLGGEIAHLRVGDRAVFAAIAASLGVPPSWQRRLARSFGDEQALERALSGDHAAAELGTETNLGADPTLPQAMVDALEREDLPALETIIADAIATARMSAGTRRPREIATRLMEHRDPGVLTLGASERETLRRFLATDVPFDAVTDAVSALGVGGDTVRDVLASHGERVAALLKRGIDPALIRFQGSFGRPLDYYTGLVFEVSGSGGHVLAAGGRYDRLLTMLGAPEPVPAIGFAIFLEAFEGAE